MLEIIFLMQCNATVSFNTIPTNVNFFNNSRGKMIKKFFGKESLKYYCLLCSIQCIIKDGVFAR